MSCWLTLKSAHERNQAGQKHGSEELTLKRMQSPKETNTKKKERKKEGKEKKDHPEIVCVCVCRVIGAVRIAEKPVAKCSYTAVEGGAEMEHLNSVLTYSPESVKTMVTCVTHRY